MKKLLLLLTLALCAPMSFAQNLPSYVPADGLVGYWPFNGNANDESGNNNNGTVNGATLTTDRFGNNNAYNFDGNSFIQIDNWNSIIGNTPFTVSFWTNPNQNNNGWALAFGSSLNGQGFCVGNWHWGSENFGAQIWKYDYISNTLTTTNFNTWSNIIIVYNNNTINAYKNGILVATQVVNYVATSLSQGVLNFGKQISFNEFYSGSLDEIAIYNRALTQQEITNMYNGVTYSDTCNAVSGSLTKGLVGYWPFCGNANDDSGHGNDGTVNGATLTTDRFGNTISAYSFNGTNSQIIIPDNSQLDLTNDFTITSWFYLNSFGSMWSNILSKHHQINGQGTYTYGIVSALIPSPQLAFQADPYFGTIANSGTNGQVSLNQWYNYTVSYQKSNSLLKYYLNGVLISTINISFNIIDNSDNLIIGHEEGPFDLTRWFNGKIDDIGIWNRALTAQEVSQLYNQNQCMSNITVTDTLIINIGQLSYTNPIYYANNITLYPNPANTQVNISFNNITDLTGGQIKIINSLGQQVATTPITLSGTNTTMPITAWGGTGLYFVQILNAQGIVVDVKKIILQ